MGDQHTPAQPAGAAQEAEPVGDQHETDAQKKDSQEGPARFRFYEEQSGHTSQQPEQLNKPPKAGDHSLQIHHKDDDDDLPFRMRIRKFFTGYQGPGEERDWHDVVRSVVTIVVILLAFMTYLKVRNWWEYTYLLEGTLPGFLTAGGVCIIGIWIWHTLDIRHPSEEYEVFRPYFSGWVFWHLGGMLNVVVWPIKLLRKSGIGLLRLSLSFAGGIFLVHWLGLSQLFPNLWNSMRVHAVLIALVWFVVYWFVRLIQWGDTYVTVDEEGKVTGYASTFFKSPLKIWRGQAREEVKWEDIDETEADFWRIPLLKEFAPQTHISLQTQEGFSVHLECFTKHTLKKISRISDERRRQTKVEHDAHHRVALAKEMSKLTGEEYKPRL